MSGSPLSLTIPVHKKTKNPHGQVSDSCLLKGIRGQLGLTVHSVLMLTDLILIFYELILTPFYVVYSIVHLLDVPLKKLKVVSVSQLHISSVFFFLRTLESSFLVTFPT